MVAQLLLGGNNGEPSSKSGYFPATPQPTSPRHRQLESKARSLGISSPLVGTEEAGVAVERQVPELWEAEVLV